MTDLHSTSRVSGMFSPDRHLIAKHSERAQRGPRHRWVVLMIDPEPRSLSKDPIVVLENALSMAMRLVPPERIVVSLPAIPRVPEEAIWELLPCNVHRRAENESLARGLTLALEAVLAVDPSAPLCTVLWNDFRDEEELRWSCLEEAARSIDERPDEILIFGEISTTSAGSGPLSSNPTMAIGLGRGLLRMTHRVCLT